MGRGGPHGERWAAWGEGAKTQAGVSDDEFERQAPQRSVQGARMGRSGPVETAARNKPIERALSHPHPDVPELRGDPWVRQRGQAPQRSDQGARTGSGLLTARPRTPKAAQDHTSRSLGATRPAGQLLPMRAPCSLRWGLPSNLVTLCTTHHRLLHHGRLAVERLPDGTLESRFADGRCIRTDPRGTPLTTRRPTLELAMA